MFQICFRANPSQDLVFGISKIIQKFQGCAHKTVTLTSIQHTVQQYMADQLTRFEPGRADYPHLLILSPPKYFHLWVSNSDDFFLRLPICLFQSLFFILL